MSKPEKSWFRAYAEMVDDEKLRLLAFEDRWHFVALMCCKRSGLLDNGDAHDLLCRKVAVKLGLQLRELEAMAARLGEVGLIEPATFQPLAWAERQFESDSSTARVREYRARKKAATADPSDETRMKRCVAVSETAQETETETEHIYSPRARDGEPEPETPQPSPGALATRAMIDAGMPAIRVNPSHPELLAALAAGVTPAELADAVREFISRGTGPPALVYVIRTVVGRRKALVRQQENPDACQSTATRQNRSPSGRAGGSRPSALQRVVAGIMASGDTDGPATDAPEPVG